MSINKKLIYGTYTLAQKYQSMPKYGSSACNGNIDSREIASPILFSTPFMYLNVNYNSITLIYIALGAL